MRITTAIVVSMQQEDIWDIDAAQRYDTPGTGMFAPEVLGPTVDYLAELAAGGQAALPAGPRDATARTVSGADYRGLRVRQLPATRCGRGGRP